MEILKGIEIVDLALYLKKEKVLIIADTHIGYEEALNKQGVLVPRISFKELILKLEKILKKTGKLDRIIVNGDIKHEFGKISETEWRHTLRLLDFLSKHCKEVILVKGNHDTILGPIAGKRNVSVKDFVKIKNILIVHGDILVKKGLLRGIKTIIIGHEHPAITIRDVSRAEKYKCFLKGKYLRKNLIVMPSLNLLVYGLDVTATKKFSPFLKQKLDNFEVYIVSDKVYDFGKIKKLENKII